MKLLLKKAARINFTAGEVVEASPAQAAFLISVGAAVAIVDTEVKETAAPKRETRKGTAKK